jgi:hypothetical protein
MPRIPVLTGTRESQDVVALTAVVLGAAGIVHALDGEGRLVEAPARLHRPGVVTWGRSWVYSVSDGVSPGNSRVSTEVRP